MNKKKRKKDYKKLLIIFKQVRNKEKPLENIIKFKIFKIKSQNLTNFKIHSRIIKNHNGKSIQKSINTGINTKGTMMKNKKDQILKESKNYLNLILIVIKVIIDHDFIYHFSTSYFKPAKNDLARLINFVI